MSLKQAGYTIILARDFSRLKPPFNAVVFVLIFLVVVIDHKTGERLAATYEGSRKVFFPQRTVDTYKPSTGKKTHITEMVTKGILFPKRVAETTKTNQSDENKTITRPVTKGIFFMRKVDETDKSDPQLIVAPD